MPLYEYQCDACGHRFEAIQKFSDPALETCPKCGGAVRKLQSAPAFQFKGSGWYITDYAKKDQPATKSEAGAKETETAGKDTAGKKDTAAKAEKTEKAGPKSEPSAKSAPTSSTTSKDT